MSDDEQLRIALAEARGWVWYRVPNPGGLHNEHRTLAHPSIQEYEGQSPCWLVRADGTERTCNMDYMTREGHLPQLTLDELNAAERELLTTETMQDEYCYLLSTRCRIMDGIENPPKIRPFEFVTSGVRDRAKALLQVIKANQR